LIKELINREITTPNSDVNLVFVDSDCDSLGAELVDTLTFSHEHDLEFLAFRVVVDELSKALVNGVVLHRDVNCDPLLQLDDIVLESFDFNLCILELS
jgi:hypothetical protein